MSKHCGYDCARNHVQGADRGDVTPRLAPHTVAHQAQRQLQHHLHTGPTAHTHTLASAQKHTQGRQHFTLDASLLVCMPYAPWLPALGTWSCFGQTTLSLYMRSSTAAHTAHAGTGAERRHVRQGHMRSWGLYSITRMITSRPTSTQSPATSVTFHKPRSNPWFTHLGYRQPLADHNLQHEVCQPAEGTVKHLQHTRGAHSTAG